MPAAAVALTTLLQLSHAGGPGCSSEIAIFYENGPYSLAKNLSLLDNPYGWDVNANVIYVDQPINTGFSWSDVSSTSCAAHWPNQAPGSRPARSYWVGTLGCAMAAVACFIIPNPRGLRSYVLWPACRTRVMMCQGRSWWLMTCCSSCRSSLRVRARGLLGTHWGEGHKQGAVRECAWRLCQSHCGRMVWVTGTGCLTLTRVFPSCLCCSSAGTCQEGLLYLWRIICCRWHLH